MYGDDTCVPAQPPSHRHGDRHGADGQTGTGEHRHCGAIVVQPPEEEGYGESLERDEEESVMVREFGHQGIAFAIPEQVNAEAPARLAEDRNRLPDPRAARPHPSLPRS